ncbi:MAG: magnesium/cobalt transporter CorA [Melioribacteraceae bacterium]|nr:MAG: magnesium/cobalt transporter CorA [Melioribacteraceae bacterium]
MKERKKSIKAKTGKPPGTLLYLGEKEITDSQITFLDYNQDLFEKRKIKTIEQFSEAVKNVRDDTVSWVNINGLHNIELITKIGKLFQINSLVLEDILNVYQRPKIEFYDDHIFAVLKFVGRNENNKLYIEQVSIIVSKDFVITFQDNTKNIFENIYERIENGKTVFRKSKQDYLFYVLIDFIVDYYFVVNEELNDEIDHMQEKLFSDIENNYLEDIHKLKKIINKVRQAIRPSRDILTNILREDLEMINKNTLVYFRDTHDHLTQINEGFDLTRESVISLFDTYLSTLSIRMNEVMKVLTIIATIFIPLTFIAGVYGMNFKYMPELEWRYGYGIIWAVMTIIGLWLIIYFKKKKWF